MKRAFPFPALVLLGLAAAALAINAEADLLPGDRLHGNIIAPGDSDALSIYLPADTLIDAEALAEKGSLILPGLSILDPDGEPLDLVPYAKPGPKGVGLKVKKVPAGSPGGVFTFTVTGGDGTAGKYSFRSKAKMGKKFTATLPVPAGEGATLSFDAPAGSVMSWKVKASKGFSSDGLSVVGITAPDESGTALDGLKGKKFPLSQDGTWVFSLANGGAADTSADVTITLALPKASKRVLYLSPFGFGEAPKVTSILPSQILDDRTAEGIEILGAGFDPAAAVHLERKGRDPASPLAFSIEHSGLIVADFDPTPLEAGSWSVVVENPSGGTGTGKLKVQSASGVRLPKGVIEGTEVWWLDFDTPSFRSDLALLGLGSSSATTRTLSEAAVKSYALYYLRRAFGLRGSDGRTEEGSVPVSFILEAPASTLGQPGVTYNRIRIGGAAMTGDPSSNPHYPWGNSPLDEGNASFEDLAPEKGAGLGLRTAALAPSASIATPEWNASTLPLRSVPLTAVDDPYYSGAAPQSGAQGTRYRDIEKATRTVGKELGATLAHFLARSMGVDDGISGASLVPLKVGEFAALPAPGFNFLEMELLISSARTGLPGKSKGLEAAWFPARETLPYLLPNGTSAAAYEQAFGVVGGRPDALPGEVVYAGVAGVIPPGYSITTGGALSGTAPLRDGNSQLVGGVYRFLVRYRDKSTGDESFFSHRLNLLVDTSHPALNPAEVALGQQLNAQTLATP